MKGFIEVTEANVLVLVNINNIVEVGQSWISTVKRAYYTKESYEEIKELIKQAQ